ncbi:MAG: cyclic pyranopterin monophosphate synthase accessory protein [Lysobacteraceae bacterium]|nr:MAG: cyclic pyranopterin monophosphate synthase accessory protein [Xanthomonadaceae bacterium]
MSEITHIDAQGRPTMVDVSAKDVSLREAAAECFVQLPAEAKVAISGDQLVTKKGPVFHTAIIAGTMAARRTHDLIPFCHPLNIEKCKVTIDLESDDRVRVVCKVAVHHRTGVEMEALTGASVAALTIYDMLKGLSHDIVIGPIQLLSKSGGRRDFERSP